MQRNVPGRQVQRLTSGIQVFPEKPHWLVMPRHPDPHLHTEAPLGLPSRPAHSRFLLLARGASPAPGPAPNHAPTHRAPMLPLVPPWYRPQLMTSLRRRATRPLSEAAIVQPVAVALPPLGWSCSLGESRRLLRAGRGGCAVLGSELSVGLGRGPP